MSSARFNDDGSMNCTSNAGVMSVPAYGCVDFLNTDSSRSNFLRVTNSAVFAPGTGNFTCEWWQNIDKIYPSMRVFGIGVYIDVNLGCSFEGTQVAGLIGGQGLALGDHNITLGVWEHWAIVRSSGVAKAYKNGVNVSGAGVSSVTNIVHNASEYFLVGGGESTDGVTSGYTIDGRLAGFHCVIGTALYTSNFAKPTSLPTLHANTKLLLNAKKTAPFTDTSTVGNTVTVVGNCAWNSARPV
jgi:hypothetical protein